MGEPLAFALIVAACIASVLLIATTFVVSKIMFDRGLISMEVWQGSVPIVSLVLLAGWGVAEVVVSFS